MSRPLRISFDNAVYHITARGNRKEKIFYSDDELTLDFNLTKRPGLVWVATEYYQYNFILSLALFFTIITIWECIIQHQDMKNPLQ